MIEAYRLVFPDGYKGYWHINDAFVDLMVAFTAEMDDLVLECQEFANEAAVDHANDQCTS